MEFTMFLLFVIFGLGMFFFIHASAPTDNEDALIDFMEECERLDGTVVSRKDEDDAVVYDVESHGGIFTCRSTVHKSLNIGDSVVICVSGNMCYLIKDLLALYMYQNEQNENVGAEVSEVHNGIVKSVSFTSYPTSVSKDAYSVQLEDGNCVTISETVSPPHNTGDVVTVFKKGDTYTFKGGANV